jgi:hypothetical protein
MSNRRGRGRPKGSYAARVQRRSAPDPARATVTLRRWISLPWPPLTLAVTAEVGHLIAAYLAWPDSPVRGAGHVILGGLLGLVAAVVLYGPHPLRLAAAGAVALIGPLWWLGGALAGATPYQSLPTVVAAAVTLAELTLATALLGTSLADRTTIAPDTGRARTTSRPA